jgi:hypothetical protein
MLTIQATQEAKKGRIMDPDQPVQNNLEDPISMEKIWERWYMPVIPGIVCSIK